VLAAGLPEREPARPVTMHTLRFSQRHVKKKSCDYRKASRKIA